MEDFAGGMVRKGPSDRALLAGLNAKAEALAYLKRRSSQIKSGQAELLISHSEVAGWLVSELAG